jgi:hypothetical protein
MTPRFCDFKIKRKIPCHHSTSAASVRPCSNPHDGKSKAIAGMASNSLPLFHSHVVRHAKGFYPERRATVSTTNRPLLISGLSAEFLVVHNHLHSEALSNKTGPRKGRVGKVEGSSTGLCPRTVIPHHFTCRRWGADYESAARLAANWPPFPLLSQSIVGIFSKIMHRKASWF